MTKGFTVPTLSRRTALAGLGISAVALASQRLAFAQQATPAAQVFSRIDHPVNGAWHWNDRAAEIQSTGIFSPDGTYLEYQRENGVGIGFWRPTGEDTAELVVNFERLEGGFRSLEGPVDMFELDYVPAGHEFGLEVVVTFRQKLRLDASGASMTGSGIFQVWNQAAHVFTSIHSDTLGRKGNRLVVVSDDSTPAS